MIASLETCLIVTALIPILAAVGTFCAILLGRTQMGLILARTEFASGFVCAAILALRLAQEASPASPVIQTSDLTWFSFTGEHSFSLAVGLEATCIKACLISLTGGIALLVLGGVGSRCRQPFSDDIVLTISLLYAAGLIFVFAPNLAQALLGWCAVTLLTAILIRLARERILTSQQDSVTSLHLTSPRQNPRSSGAPHHSLQAIANGAASGGRFVTDHIWRPLTRNLPNWIGEQVESLENSPASLQFIATIFAASAILLTWLY